MTTEKLKTFKGTSKDLKCHGGFQYELGKTVTDTTAVRCSSRGFHSCEAPLDVLRYFPLRDGNRYFSAEAAGAVSRDETGDSKIATSELTLKAEIGLPGLVKAHLEYTRRRAEVGGSNGDGVNLAGGDYSNLAGGARSNLAGGAWSNLAGGAWSNLAGGADSNLAGGAWSNLAGGDWSNLAGGARSNLAGGADSNLAGGADSNLAGGARSNLAGGARSNLAGGDWSLIVGRNGCKAKAGKNSVIVLTEWDWRDGEWTPLHVKAVIVDGETVKVDTWYTLKNGELVETEENT